MELPTHFPAIAPEQVSNGAAAAQLRPGDSSPPVTPRPHSWLDGRLDMILNNDQAHAIRAVDAGRGGWE